MHAWPNGMLSHGMDYDDTHTTATLHPSCVIVPTALAVGEATGASGAEVLAAAIVGFEVVARLGLLASREFQNRGFHPTSVLGVFGAVATVSRLMGVSAVVGRNATGLAGSMASGLMEYLSDGSSAKQVHPGWAAQAAVTAVRLAQAGATGPARVLEGTAGYSAPSRALTSAARAYSRLSVRSGSAPWSRLSPTPHATVCTRRSMPGGHWPIASGYRLPRLPASAASPASSRPGTSSSSAIRCPPSGLLAAFMRRGSACRTRSGSRLSTARWT